MGQRVRIHAARALLLVALIIGWELLGRSTSRLFFTPISSVIPVLIEMAASGETTGAALVSLLDLLGGYIPAALVGVALGWLVGRSRFAEAAARPYVTALLVTPLVALTPLILFAFGIGTGARMATVFLFGIAQVVVGTATAVRNTPVHLLEMAAVFNAKPFARFRHVIYPSAIPGIFAGLRLGLGQALVGMIISEFLVSAAGLGGLLVYYSARFRMDALLATVLVIALFAVTLNAILGLLERAAIPRGAQPATEY